ncbi:hypothetical protein [Rudaeicoccus suwonensis]|uniref:Uncharacterized protein n=1 Tax=Rudaeicoccus suwonensis TaxID=657409 RepID=A0A561E8Y2_9MICO|nr:hypothetical protein [Rudaeicoccus suwonensis]TWE12066.1 hypothetical protein BKA23_0862 [Rudaeicoccus suwonensis]
MNGISVFFTGFVVINAIALALFVAFAATNVTKFFVANRRVRVSQRQPLVRYYSHMALGH